MKYYCFDIVIGIEDNLDLSKFTLNELTTLIRTNVNKIMGIDYKEVKLKKQLQKEIKVSGDSLTEFWDNPEDNRWDKEYNPNLLPETLKNKEERQGE